MFFEMRVDFFIVGAPKSGTTSLYHYLDEHPDIEMSNLKEPNFFSDESLQFQNIYNIKNRVNTLEKYHALFKRRDECLKGEASVSYLFYEDVPEKIFSYNPEAKIIIILRNPIDRAYSHYLMDHSLGLISDSFHNIIRKKSKHKKSDFFYQQYIEVSKYTAQISRYFKVFKKENIYIIDYEEFKSNTSHIVGCVFSFLGLNNKFRPDLKQRYNIYTAPRNSFIRFCYTNIPFRNNVANFLPRYLRNIIKRILFTNDKKPIMLEKNKLLLKECFKNDVRQLSKLLDQDFTKWIK